MDQLDDDWMRGPVGADREHGVLPPHAQARRAARAARLGRHAHAPVGRRDDRGRVDYAAGRVAGGRRGGALPWALLVAGSIASLAANVAVAEPDLIGRVIAAWPSFALTASYELLTRQVRGSAPARDEQGSAAGVIVRSVVPRPKSGDGTAPPRELQRQAWRWALANRAGDGTLPAGTEIAHQYGRRERWGRLVKSAGLAGELPDITPEEAAGGGRTPSSHCTQPPHGSGSDSDPCRRDGP